MSALLAHLAGMAMSQKGNLLQTGKHTMTLLALFGTFFGLWFFSGILEKVGVFAVLRVLLLLSCVPLICILLAMILYDGLCRRKKAATTHVHPLWQ